jgi:hypothetical protein
MRTTSKAANVGGKTLDDYFADWEAHVFGYGYGTGEEHTIPALRHFFSSMPKSGCYDYQNLETTVGPEVAWLLINILCRADIIEYGSSPRFGWLTPQGKSLREFLEPHTVDELVAITRRDEDYAHCFPDGCNCGPEGYDENRICQNPFWKHK